MLMKLLDINKIDNEVFRRIYIAKYCNISG